jgi:DNA-binding response OmpR family regulator
MRGLIQLIFERQGHRVIGAKRGEFGLEFLRSLKPDVLLLDLMLPDIDGWEIYRQMKEDTELSKIAVIVVSARSEAHDAAAGKHVIGNDRYIEKPFSVQGLIEAVNEITNQLPVN